MKKSKKIAIGGIVLVLLLLVGFIVYRERIQNVGFYQKYYEYHFSSKTKSQSYCDNFILKCKETGGAFTGNSECKEKVCNSSCPQGARCVDPIVDCVDFGNICKCSFLERWSNERGCTYL